MTNSGCVPRCVGLLLLLIAFSFMIVIVFLVIVYETPNSKKAKFNMLDLFNLIVCQNCTIFSSDFYIKEIRYEWGLYYMAWDLLHMLKDNSDESAMYKNNINEQ